MLMLWLALGCGGATDVRPDGKPPDPPIYPTGSTPVIPPTETHARRADCSGMDPADPAPLGGRVALSFDDGPEPTDTPVIVEILRRRHIPATFMVLGDSLSNADTWPIFEQIVADPLFDVGNHSWSHSDLATLAPADVAAEIDDTTALIETFGVSPRYFRFPYGDSTCVTHDMATDRGLRVTGWHIDTADWCYAAGDGLCTTDDYWRVPPIYASDMLGLSLEQIRRFDGGILLFHDIHAWTAAQLEGVIDALQADGFTFVALDDLDAFPLLNAGTPADLPYLGEPCDTVADTCWQVEHAAWCEPNAAADPTRTDGVCTLPCEGYCLDRDGAATTFCAEITPGVGQCVGRSQEINGWCALVPGSVEREMGRHVGLAGTYEASATVCAPASW